jgi:hypothetical protein
MTNIIHTLRDGGTLKCLHDYRIQGPDDTTYTDHSTAPHFDGAAQATLLQARSTGIVPADDTWLHIDHVSALMPATTFAFAFMSPEFTWAYSVPPGGTNNNKMAAMLYKGDTLNNSLHIYTAEISGVQRIYMQSASGGATSTQYLDLDSTAAAKAMAGRPNMLWLAGTWGGEVDCYIDSTKVGTLSDTCSAKPTTTDDWIIGNSVWDYNNAPATKFASSHKYLPFTDGLTGFAIFSAIPSEANRVKLLNYWRTAWRQKLKSVLDQGGGRIEYLLHIGGYPYAVATSPAVISALEANLDIKRRIFGKVSLTNGAGTTSYPADTCTTYLGLQCPTDQKFSLERDTGMLSGGNWQAKLALDEIPRVYSYRNDQAIVGYDGISNVPDPFSDSSICYGEMTAHLFKDSASLALSDNTGALSAKIAANASSDLPTYLWIGTECIAAGSSAGTQSLAVDIDEDQPNCARGVFRSQIQSFLIDSTAGSSFLVCD